nr:large subunit GTPase 1 homolog [Parasteatoda tepidariorum]
MPKKELALGRSLIKAHKRKKNIVVKDGYRHTSDLLDGRDFNRLDLKSVTEQTSLDDFLSTTALAENDFNAEFSDVKLIQNLASSAVLSEEEKHLISLAQEENKDVLCIPRRPSWDENTSKAELDAQEREAFLTWRRKLAMIQEQEHLNLTPFEKNLEVWRQLWRVIERSHVIVQIIDARNPLLFRCHDLETYVKEVDENKINVLLLNKADFLTESERQCWSDYFEKNGIQVAFFSALQQIERAEDHEAENSVDDENSNIEIDLHKVKNSTKVLSREELINFLKAVTKIHNISAQRPTVGLVGYPNVGKSSTINAILMSKKVSVSATPGKTKHFQTFIIDEDLCLCDCPGLVFPNFVSTKAEMVINGILPIDQLTEWNQPVSLVTNLIPRQLLESSYSLLIPSTGEKGRDTIPTAEEFLNAHGYSRGYMTSRGLPDNARSARYILKDFINGKLLYCFAPPGIKQEDYHKFEMKAKKISHQNVPKENEVLEKKETLSAADKKFFAQAHLKSKGSIGSQDGGSGSKPWKKHNNRNKKEKLRRVYHNPYE